MTDKKQCSKCTYVGPKKAFPKNGNGYHYNYCQGCHTKYHTEYMRMWRNVKRDRYNTYMRDYMRKRREPKEDAPVR